MDTWYIPRKWQKCPKAAVLKLIKHKLQGENLHYTAIWGFLTVKFDTVYKVQNYLPNIPIPTFYFLQDMRYHSPLWSLFIFPLCLCELWAPFSVRTAKKCSITSSRKTTRALSSWWNFFSSLNLAFFVNKLFPSLMIFCMP